jgi:hypothetical protein
MEDEVDELLPRITRRALLMAGAASVAAPVVSIFAKQSETTTAATIMVRVWARQGTCIPCRPRS